MKKKLVFFLFMIFTIGILAADVVISGNFSDYNYYGSSTKQGNELIFTQNSLNQAGAIWSNKMVDLSKNFRIEAELYMGDKDANGADGVTFFFKPYEDKNDVIGNTGGGLGYESANFPNTFGLEIDTWYNSDKDSISTDHIAFVKSGSSVGISDKDLGNIEDNAWHSIIINWNASTKTLSYSLKGVTGSYNGGGEDLLAKINTGNDANHQNMAYFGYTASTGGSYNKQGIRNIQVDATIPESQYPLTITETVSPSKYRLGTSLTYTVTIGNRGTETISNLDLSSNTGIDFSGDGWTNYSGNIYRKTGLTIPAGGTVTVTGTRTATSSDVTNTEIINTTSIKGYTSYGTSSQSEYTDAYESRVTYSPMDYTVTEVAYSDPKDGFTIESDGTIKYTYKFKIENTGGTELKNLTYKNTKTPGTLINISGNLAVGASKEITYEYILTDAEKNSNGLNNEIIINAIAIDDSGNLEKSLTFATVSSEVSAMETNVTNTITGSSDNTKIQALGNIVNYSLTIKNIKSSTLGNLEAVIIRNKDLNNLPANDRTFAGVKASSTKLGLVSNFTPTSLGKDAISTGSFQYTVTQDDIDEGNLNTTIFLKGEIGSDVYTVQENNNISIDETSLNKEISITVNPLVYNSSDSLISGNQYSTIGDKIKYSFQIENTGKRTIKNLKLVDPLDSNNEIDLGISALNIGTTQIATDKYIRIIEASDLNNGEVNYDFLIKGDVGSFDSIAKIENSIVTGDLNDDYELKVVIEEGANFTNQGINLKYHYELKNIGNRVLSGLELKDTLTNTNSVTLDKTQINPNEIAISSTLTHVITTDNFNNGSINIQGEAQALRLSGQLLTKNVLETVNKFDFSKINLSMSSTTPNLTYGTLVDYTIDIQNISTTTDAVNLKLIDEIEEIRNANNEKVFENVQLISVKNGVNDVIYTGDINALIFTLPKTSTVQIKVRANIKGSSDITLSSGENIINTVSIFGKIGTASQSIAVDSPDLVVTTDVTTDNSDKIIEVGEGVTYTIDITNSSSLDINDVIIIDKITEIVNSKNELVFFKPLTTDRITIVDSTTSTPIPFTYNAVQGKIVISKIQAGKDAHVQIKPTVKSNISFSDGEVITNLFTVNGNTYSHILNALTGVIQGMDITSNVVTTLSNNKIMLDEEFTYNIEVKNKGTNLNLLNVKVLSDIEDTLNSKNKKAFKDVVISRIYNKETNVNKTGISWPTSFTNGRLELPEILANETIVIEIKAKPNDLPSFVQNEQIIIDSKSYLNNSAQAVEHRLTPTIVIPELTVEKTANRADVAMGENLTYTIKITNNSSTEAKNLKIEDNILGIEGNTSAGLKEQVFLNWTWTVDSAHSSLRPADNSPLSILSSQNVNLASGDSIIFTVTGLTNKDIIDDNFSNTVYVTEDLTQIKKEATATSKINKEGIVVTKTANKTEAKRGNFVKYTLSIYNSNSVQMKDIKIVDVLPPGFEYMKDSSLLTDNDNTKAEIHPLGRDTLTFNTLNGSNLEIKAKETIKISYILKVGLGVKDGKAINTAMVKSFSNQVVSNIATYRLDIITDPLFDSGSIIGKVFNDIDEDGYQDSAIAKEVKVVIDNPSKSPISLTRNKFRKVVTPKFVLKELKPGEKVIIEFKNRTNLLSEIKLNTKAGTNLILKSNGKSLVKHIKDKKRGLTGEKIVINRIKTKNGLERIEIKNEGKNEEGIPGARLMTIDGLIIETDNYGRFHVPVLKGEKTNNYLIKLDLDSLPMGTYITTENPKVMRRTRTISKFNFGVVVPNEQLSGKRGDM
ncbi:MAG: hypothetical protein Q7K47_08785 [Fusobacterium sp. JB019]|nr:hypothetical protein [Fusobacterium sp. JB019]